MDVNPTVEMYDALVVGGGPAGLSAAVNLARACRSVAVVDCRREGRSDWQQVNRNYLGFPDGVTAIELGKIGRAQAEAYGARFFDAEVARLARDGTVFTAQAAGGLALHGRAVILATGVKDRWTDFPGYEAYVGKTLHWCIVCDGFEMQGQRVLVVGNDDHTAELAIQMLRFTREVSILTNSGSLGMPSALVQQLDDRGIRLVVGRLAGARSRKGEEGAFAAVQVEGADEIELELDHLFSYQGADPNCELARSLGVDQTAGGYLKVDAECRTSVPGVYAAGDVTRYSSHQVSTAVHEGAVAAAALNHDLYLQDQAAFEVGRGG
jgi:thioredoxin reductase (NADPH)